MDQHVSWWGYYTRFNGGFLSTLTYYFLFYAFASNLSLKHVIKTLYVSIISASIVIAWGLPAHYGYDPTCLVFRGTLDTSCWTFAFKPEVRIFSTLGQPAWLAAYIATLFPLAIAFFLHAFYNGKKKTYITFLALTTCLLAALIFTNTRAGLIGIFVTDIILWGLLLYKKIFALNQLVRLAIVMHGLFLITIFFVGLPLGKIYDFTLPGILQKQKASQPQPTQEAGQSSQETTQQAQTPAPQPQTGGITDSGDIRRHVWKGAIDAWKANPIFGTGVETFAFAYYKYKPAEHNLTSEWDYLYNKAHNEYLNYLTTTGLFGLGTYLAFIALFAYLTLRYLLLHHHNHHENGNNPQHKAMHHKNDLFIIALLAGWSSILVTNFFGFSVVIINLYLFLIPLFVLYLGHMLKENYGFGFTAGSKNHDYINPYQWTFIALYVLVGAFWIYGLSVYWVADIAYALGNNFNKIGNYQDAYPHLTKAVTLKQNEPTYKDELAVNLSTLAAALYTQKDAVNGSQFANQAIALDDQVIAAHPNNVVYWKNRVRIFYTLAQGDPEHAQQYMMQALTAVAKANELAPNDAKISYNLGVLIGQVQNINQGIEVLNRTVQLKPDYKDAYVALGLFYNQLSLDNDGKLVNPEMRQKAIDTYKLIIEKIDPNDEQVKESLKSWGAS